MKNLILLSLSIVLFSRCEDPLFEKDPENTPVSNFDILWNRMDTHYVFFDYKGIDWDSIYRVYRPQISNNISDQQLFDIMEEMLNNLRDAHVNLRSEFDISYYEYYQDAPRNFDFDTVKKTYLGDYDIVGSMFADIIDSVGYVRYGSFQLPVSEENLDFLVEKFRNTKGIVLDIRDNEGGDPLNGYRLGQRIADKRRHIYTNQYKNGPDRNDLTQPDEAFLEPEGKGFDKPVVLLINRKCYSAANFFTAMMRAFPHVTIIGDITGGGGGAPTGWELPNGWHFNYSSSITRLPDGFIIEDGIPPDIRIDITDEDLLSGTDTLLERALEELN